MQGVSFRIVYICMEEKLREMIDIKLNETTRNQLIAKSKSSEKGKQRFDRRSKSKVQNTTSAMNKIDMNKLFTEDILTVGVPVKGETDDYTVTISVSGIIELLRDEVKRSGRVSFREIARATINAFNKEDVYINCSCPDFSYRFGFFASKNDFNSGAPETRPSNITNPNDSLGSACKHVLLVLNNNSWIQRIARVISNYVHYMETHYPKMYADIIYPAIYGEEYQEPAQTSMFDDDTLDSDSDTLSAANRWRQQSTRFQKGNDSGIRFAKSNRELDNQLPIEENPDDIL